MTPPSWKASDHCSNWEGIECTDSCYLHLIGLGFLSYNKDLTGVLPPLIGNLKKLTNLILAGCSFTGTIPDTIGSLEQLVFLSLNSNKFSGGISASIGNLPKLYWLDMAHNNLRGPIPVSNGSTSGLDMMLHTKPLYLSNNNLSSPVLNITGMNNLAYLMMESVKLKGELLVDLFSLSSLQTVVLKNNQADGTLDIGTTYSNQLQLIDLSYNYTTEYKKGPCNDTIILENNPVCLETETGLESYCTISSPNCRCAYTYKGILEFRAPSFSDLVNKSIYKELENKLLTSLRSHQLLVDSVALSNPNYKDSIYLDLSLEVFPYGRDRFNLTEISEIRFWLSSRTFKPPKSFGPFVFHGDEYEDYEVISTEPEKSYSSIGIIIGAAVGGSVLVLLLLLAGVYAFRQKRRA
ncbi:hypothetical protein FEM48_Zijuj08G0192900 [Ziziphus jujuba var. spinosa]|uniref:Leucine-rich repeat-containing N-terminal plant-type domain-containing protein n=1 Tax=Ziziphus jujuba var. spinosa TaxID=714518 RepID=A0A978V0W7_ZIZJJ|nr:hypothetical protein FEM48_Zijuj08G0192900 [Ziziphus jujuba var. spinosa]